MFPFTNLPTILLLLSFINEIFLVVIVSNKHMNRPGKPRVLQALSFIVMHVFFQNDMDVK